MGLAVERILTQWSKARHLRPGAHPSDGTMGVGYQRIPGIQLLGEYDLHVLVAESMADFVALVLVVLSVRFAKPWLPPN